MKTRQVKWRFVVLGVLSVLAGCFPRPVPDRPTSVRAGGYKYINPLLECEDERMFLKPFQDKLDVYISSLLRNNSATHISVYYRDLNNGPWFGVNESEGFTPASLLKVPVMVACLITNKQHPGFLEKIIRYSPTWEDANLQAFFQPEINLIVGENYTNGELINRMICQSDNNALLTLQSEFDTNLLVKTYRDLGIVFPIGTNDPENYVSVKEYASVFRVLYNATYIDRDMSEAALELLTSSNFKIGLMKGVPAGVAVAHKYGTTVFQGKKQLHDVGIVYHKDRPYLLGIMTRGDDFNRLADVIADVSRFVYNEVSGNLEKR